jgi:hypothetical protein
LPHRREVDPGNVALAQRDKRGRSVVAIEQDPPPRVRVLVEDWVATVEAAIPAGEFRLESVTVSPVEGRFTATAIIRRGEQSATGQCYRAGTVAEAAVKAVHEAVSKLRGVYATPELEDVLVGERDGKPRFVTVVAGWAGGSGASTRLVEGDEALAAASAALEAIARALEHETEEE